MTSSPAKRKRAAPVPDFEEGWDVESLQVSSVPSRKKKARVHLSDAGFESQDDASDISPSSAPSLAATATATATIADTGSPLIEASSSRTTNTLRSKKYHCSFPDCNKTFDRPVRLQTHINSHTGERPHVCPREGCTKSFYKPEHLNRHTKEKHSSNQVTCTFKVHNDQSDRIEPCGKVFESSSKLKRHLAMHEDKEDTTCNWEGCRKVFRKQETLQRHIRKDHLNEDSYMCTHETAEGGTCGRFFPTPGQLKGHEAREHNAPKYVCEICTIEMVPILEDALPEFDDLDPAFLPTPGDLQDGELESNIISSLSLEDTPPDGLQYFERIVGFPTYHDLQRHNKAVHPPTCYHCSKRCRSSKDLAAHIDIHHPPLDGPPPELPVAEKKFFCPHDGCPRSILGNGFTKKGNMDAHIKGAHTKAKDFVCGSFDLSGNKKVTGWNGKGCGMALGTKQSLIGHIRTQHLSIPAHNKARPMVQNKEQKSNIKSEMQAADTDSMEVDDAMPNHALSMLTGAGYEELRPHACILASNGCQIRFKNAYDLSVHMELTHDWTVDDINDTFELGFEAEPGAPNDTDGTLGHRLETEMNKNGDREAIDPRL